MIPSIEEILHKLIAGHCTIEEAMGWIQTHEDVACETVYKDAGEDLERKQVRDDYVCALLRTVPPGANSDMAAIFVWDTVARLMEMRERDIGRITSDVINDFRDAPPAPPETDAEQIARLQRELAARAPEVVQAVPKPAPKPMFDSDVHKGPWTPKDIVSDDDVQVQKAWGDGSKYTPTGDTEHDDGPY